VKEAFELEWMGGVPEHYFRKVRPAIAELPWGTVPVADFPPALLAAARRSWTELAVNEYRAIASFAEVLRALTLAKAPLDLLGMTSDFLADEVSHVELAGRVTMELGGAAPHLVEMDGFGVRADPGAKTHLERANDLVLKVCCIAEAFAGGTGLGHLRAASHPLTRAVHETIARDEVHHRRLGPLYFEWAADRMDDVERARLAAVAVRTLEGLARYWRHAPSAVTDGVTEEGYRVEDIHALGWLESSRYVPLAREVVTRDVLEPLARIGVVVAEDDRARLLAR
jgi:hypothetical protein